MRVPDRSRCASRRVHVTSMRSTEHRRWSPLARELVPANVDVRVEDVTTAHLPADHYDAVTSISALHHVDLGNR